MMVTMQTLVFCTPTLYVGRVADSLKTRPSYIFVALGQTLRAYVGKLTPKLDPLAFRGHSVIENYTARSDI